MVLLASHMGVVCCSLAQVYLEASEAHSGPWTGRLGRLFPWPLLVALASFGLRSYPYRSSGIHRCSHLYHDIRSVLTATGRRGSHGACAGGRTFYPLHPYRWCGFVPCHDSASLVHAGSPTLPDGLSLPLGLTRTWSWQRTQ